MKKQQPKNQSPWIVEYYIAESGNSPAVDFLNGLSTDEKADAIKIIKLLRDRGIGLNLPEARKIRGYIIHCGNSGHFPIGLFIFYIQDEDLSFCTVFRKSRTEQIQINLKQQEKDIVISWSVRNDK